MPDPIEPKPPSITEARAKLAELAVNTDGHITITQVSDDDGVSDALVSYDDKLVVACSTRSKAERERRVILRALAAANAPLDAILATWDAMARVCEAAAALSDCQLSCGGEYRCDESWKREHKALKAALAALTPDAGRK